MYRLCNDVVYLVSIRISTYCSINAKMWIDMLYRGPGGSMTELVTEKCFGKYKIVFFSILRRCSPFID